ncbi:MAG TPA: peroxiredoxin-like family protein [Verrucomicrobiae bacterium]|nr:peroxiredoxin-like family protein [Verrucomicrobiae bacterium]
MKSKILLLLAAGLFACSFVLNAAETPKVGDKAPDFTLKTLDGKSVTLSSLYASNKVVLIVLRGWPGYQCPICERQVGDYIATAAKLDEAQARIIMVYPGPADALQAHAREFVDMKGKQWPEDFTFVIDPDYSMVNAYGLRWNAPNETSYPSTFVLDKKGVIHFEEISHTHGDRSKASDTLKELQQVPE